MLLHTFLLICIAEMADKTQFMIMALSSRFSLKNILCGMISGICIIAGLSVLAGDIIGDSIPVPIIKLSGGIMFLLFGLWNLRPSIENQDTHQINSKLPIISIALSFILCELGDKTQLATLALAADHMKEHLPIFIGSSLGLIMANIIGLFAGKLLFAKLSEDHVKLVSSFCFFFFGSITLFELLPGNIMIYSIYSCCLLFLAYNIFVRTRRNS